MKQYFKNPFFYSSLAAVVILGLIISSYVLGWTTAPPNPPSGNLSAPLNVGSTNQSKTGYLAIGTSTSPSFSLDVAGVLRVGNFSSAPTGAAGAIYYNTTTNKFQGYQSGAWTDIGGSTFNPPPGMITIFARSECPTGWIRVSDLDNKLPLGSISYGQSIVIPNVSSYIASSYKSYGFSVIWCAWGGLPPSQVTATAIICHNRVKLTWSEPNNNGSPITSYKIYKNSSYLDSVSSSTLSYVVTGLTDGTTYTFNVSAVNGAGEGAKSSDINIIPNYRSVALISNEGAITCNTKCNSYYGSSYTCYSVGVNSPSYDNGIYNKPTGCGASNCRNGCPNYPPTFTGYSGYSCDSTIPNYSISCYSTACDWPTCTPADPSPTYYSYIYCKCDCTF